MKCPHHRFLDSNPKLQPGCINLKTITNNFLENKKIAVYFALLLTACYLVVVNYRLPFMSMDEIRSIVDPLKDRFHLIGLYGRPSQVFGLLINLLISFRDVEFFSLTPRFMTMIALLFSLVVFFQKVGIQRTSSVLAVCFAIVTHELDWQHNGLVAFYGGYNLMLAMFLLGISLHDGDRKNNIRWMIAYLLILMSFASEFFVGLVVIYLIALWLEGLKFNKIVRSPFFVALLTYLIFYFLLKLSSQEEAHSSRMNNYLVGALSDFSLQKIGEGVTIYFVNSIPLYGLGPILSISIAGAAVALTVVFTGIVGAYVSIPWSAWERMVQKINNSNIKKISLSDYSVLLCLVFAPSILMSLQPMKLEWALSGASTRYAFSLYSWIGIVGFIVIFFRFNPIRHFVAKVFIFTVVIAYVVMSASSNIRFLSLYNTSFANWKLLNERLLKSKDSVVDLPISLFNHPYIVSPLTPDRKMMDKFSEYQYGKTIRICRDGFDFYGPLVIPIDANKITEFIPNIYGAEGRNDAIVRIGGFHGIEENGRWTNGSSSEIYLNENLQTNDVVELDISEAFFQNSVRPTQFKIGENLISVIIDHARTVSIAVTKNVRSPVVVINPPKPSSPSALAQGIDKRVIGIKIKSVRILRPDQNGNLKNISQGCF